MRDSTDSGSQSQRSWARQAIKFLGFKSLGLLLLTPVFIARPAIAADRIYFSYGALERSISVNSLETYARNGKIDRDLADYTQYADAQQLAQLRTVLLARIPLSPVAVSQFLYTSQGEAVLNRLGQVIQTEARQPGFYALRAALILGADQPEGLTLLNVLRKFPTRSVRIDVSRSLEFARILETLVTQTQKTIAAVERQATTESTNDPQVDFTQLPDLRKRGRLTWEKQVAVLTDRSRNRTFPVDLYIPQARQPQARQRYPVIVISHGLGSDRSTFAYLAEHLASYGFMVAVPEHPGSNATQLIALLSGKANEVAEPTEFIDRPLDVKYLLDYLTSAQADPMFQGRLNLEQVGVIGQSFGAYTALALAGAPIDFQHLQKSCIDDETFNISLLLQCRALELTPPRSSLYDPRVKAVIAVNPPISGILGQESLSQIKIPVLIGASSADTVAPALSEQIQPFTWLTTPDKYFALIEGATHFSTLADAPPGSTPVALPSQVIGPSPMLARRYLAALSVAFSETYVANRLEYRPYLSAAYAKSITQLPLSLSLTRSFTATQLDAAIKGSVE